MMRAVARLDDHRHPPALEGKRDFVGLAVAGARLDVLVQLRVREHGLVEQTGTTFAEWKRTGISARKRRNPGQRRPFGQKSLTRRLRSH